MTLLAAIPDDMRSAALQVVAAALLGFLGVYFLLPRPRGRRVPVGVFLCVAAAAVLAAFLVTAFGQPSPNVVGQVLFWLFSAGALGFGAVLVTQRNPAWGAIAFAFVILSSCGLFLLLAAPFLMAATVIIYAGAIIVTFLFLLMLSHTGGPADENDRTREPLLGSLAGFAFAGLVLFTLYASSPVAVAAPLPAAPLSAEDRDALALADERLRQAEEAPSVDAVERTVRVARRSVGEVVGFAPGDPAAADGDRGQSRTDRQTVQERLRVAQTDRRVWEVIDQADRLRAKAKETGDKLENLRFEANPSLDRARQLAVELRQEIALLRGRGELPGRNVSAIGYALYSEHLLAVEMAGTLLLVATIGAVAIARRKGAAA